MKLIQGVYRARFENLINQLISNRNNIESPALTSAMFEFGVTNTHDLSIRLAEILINYEIMIDAVSSGGDNRN